MRYPFNFIFFLFAFQVSVAQNNQQRTWLGASIAHEITSNLEVGLEIQHRSDRLLGTLDSYFGEAIISYETPKGVRFKTGLRFIQNNDTKGKLQGIEDHLRGYADVGYKHRLKQFQFNHRLRFQTEKELNSPKAIRENIGRFKTGATLKIKNWSLDPDLSIEVFNHLPNSNKTGLQKWRYRLETELNIGAGKLVLAYFIDREKQLNNLHFNTHILGVFYDFNL